MFTTIALALLRSKKIREEMSLLAFAIALDTVSQIVLLGTIIILMGG